MGYVSTEGVVLRTVRHNDQHTIVRLYTPDLGAIGCLTPAGNGKEACRRRGMLIPLSRIRCVVSISPGRELHRLRDVQVVDQSLLAILSHPVKGALAQFIADLLDAVLREPQPDAVMYEFISLVGRELAATEKGVANYHLLTLLRLAHHLGIEPDWGEYRRGWWLDEVEGTFRGTPPMHGHFATPAESRVLTAMHRLGAAGLGKLRLNSEQRNYFVDRVIEYYRLHDIRVGRLQSLGILRQLF